MLDRSSPRGGRNAHGSVALSDGDDQIAAAGTALPESLAVIVRDDAGAPLAGVAVAWTVTAGGGTVSPASRTSAASGLAKTRRTLGPNAGEQTARATVTGLPPIEFSAVSQVQGAVTIASATMGPLTDTVRAIKADSLTVLVTDQNAAPVAGVAVLWASTGGSVSATNVATSATGHSRVGYTYGTGAGPQSASATVTGLEGSPVNIPFQATAGTATTIVKTAGDNGTAPPSSQVTYTVTARDASANPKQGVTIDWAVATGGGSIAPAQNTTGANGTASAQRTLGSGTGDQTATATGGAPANIPDRTTGSVTRTFNTAGAFNYGCTNHPGMNGQVTVNP